MRRIARAIVFASLALGATAVLAQQDMANVEITRTQIKPGIAVLYGNGGNIGVSYGPDGTILIDDQFAALTAKIEQAVSDLGAEPTRFLINTHWHFDHAGGNENLARVGATLVAHDNVRMRLASGGSVMGNIAEPGPPEALPVITYDDGITFNMNGDVIDVMFLGGGHTDGDSVIIWRQSNVVHTGDMFMNNFGWPFIDLDSGGNVEHLLNSLGRIIAITDAETVIIPGHGQFATQSDLIAFRAMVEAGVEQVKALKDQGLSVEAAVAAHPVAGLRNADGFISDDQFVQAVWASLDAHGH